MSNMGSGSLRVRILKQATYHMIKLGFQARQTGYRYLREAIWIAYNEPSVLSAVTKHLYPKVAKHFETSDKQIERAIRNAIETAWTEGDAEVLKDFFGDIYGDGIVRPTNTDVIGKIVEFLDEFE